MGSAATVMVGLVAPIVLMLSPPFETSIAPSGWFAVLPLVLMVVGGVLAICFRQTRVSAFALVWLGVTARGGQHFGGALPEWALGDFVLVVSALLPLLALSLFLMEERRAFSTRGSVRFYVALSVLALFCWLPGLGSFHSWVCSLPVWLVGTYERAGFNLAPIAAALLITVSAVLLWVDRPESPTLGRMFVALLVVGVGAMNAPMACWGRVEALTVFRAMCLSGGMLLVWTVLDGAWRHAYVDELTQLPGRRPMRHHFASLGGDYAIAIVDIDHFKRINDRYGHDIGDQVLRFVSGSIRAVRGGAAYRFGGEEFVVVFGRRWAEGARDIADALRQQIAQHPFRLRDVDRPEHKPRKRNAGSGGKGVDIKVAVSVGVAWPTNDALAPDDVLGLADKALYRAKRGGRNKVCTAKRK